MTMLDNKPADRVRAAMARHSCRPPRVLETADSREEAWRLASGYAATITALGYGGRWRVRVRSMTLRSGRWTFAITLEPV